MRKCTKCNIQKEISEFGKDKTRKSGLQVYCKKCCSEIGIKFRKKQIVLWEKQKERNKIKYRIKKGIDLNIPYKAKPGSGYITKQGYKTISKPDHPNAWRNGRVLEHVIILTEYLNRPLKKNETVHHKNGIRHDNRIENLELWDNRHGPGQRVDDKIKWCIEFLEEYGYKVDKG